MLTAIIGFFGIILLVIAHEAGHFFAARKSGVEVEEFGIGFPPKAKVLGRKNGTEYTLNWLPLGGFVRLKGENDADTAEGSFGAASLKQKVQIMIAGVAVNFLIAYVLFSFVALIGMPKLIDNQFTIASDTKVTSQKVLVGGIADDSPASRAGITSEDSIQSIIESGACDAACVSYPITSSDDLRAVTKQLAGKEVVVQVLRAGEVVGLPTVLLDEASVAASKTTENPKGYLGVVPNDFIVSRSTWSAPIVGAGVTVQFAETTLKGLGSIVSGLSRGDTSSATEQVSGFIGIGYIFSETSFLGPIFTIMIIATISLSLAVMNILPIPALDGGRLFVTLLFRVLKKPLTKETEERIHGTGFAALMFLFVLITIIDVQRFVL